MAETAQPVPEKQQFVDEPISEVGQMSQWRLMALRFYKNKLAMVGVIGLVIMYITVFLGPFLAPNEYTYQNKDYIFGPLTQLTFIGPDGKFSLRPYVYETSTELNSEKFTWDFKINYDKKLKILFFAKGDPVTVLGIPTSIHLFEIEGGKQRYYVLGTDSLGRDLLARILVGGQVSMTIGLLGVTLSLIFGSILGTASGYYAGLTDDIMQRMIEVIQSFPDVPLWAAIAASLPPISQNFTGLDRYFLITVVLSVIGWTGLARQLRAKVMSYRQADFTQAALAAGSSDMRIILTHMIPNAASHIIVVGALSVPGMILGETALSFLGLGILPPLVSWGALLRDAQQVSVVINHPWLMLPAFAVILTVLFFSFLGDGLRDAIDPYSI
jgi:peptide/nickel transport system permease protein